MEKTDNKKRHSAKKRILCGVLILCVLCGGAVVGMKLKFGRSTPHASKSRTISDTVPSDNPLFDVNGMTAATRILPPEGYTRISAQSGSLLEYMRNMELLPNGNGIVTYDGEKVDRACAAVYALDIGGKDLQQCADSIIRVYSEYYWSRGEYDKIAFHLTNGFLMDYPTWRDGKRLVAAGSIAKWMPLASYDDSYDCFRAYLEGVMNYAGTKSLEAESETIDLADLRPGDLLDAGGSPGHAVLVVDAAENEAGEKCFLLAQGYMPAQSFHILEHPTHTDDPWFYAEDLTYPIQMGGNVFFEGSIRRWNGGFEN